MPLEFQKVTLKDLSRGIDARSAKNAIEPGFAEDLVNCETNSEGFLAKRPGYQGYYGYVPMRVLAVEQLGTALKFRLDTAMTILTATSSPIVVFGRYGRPDASVTGTDFYAVDGNGYYTDVAKYYSGFEVQYRRAMTANVAGTLTLEHGLETTNLLVGITESTSSSNLSNSVFIPDAVRIDQTDPYNVEFDYFFNGASDKNALLYVADRDTSTGSYYSANFVSGSFSANVLTITAATHGLANINPIIQVFESTGGDYVLRIPERVTIKANGNIEIELDGAFDGKVVMSDVGVTQQDEETVTAGVPYTFSITPSSGDVFFAAAYKREANTDRTLIIPDSVTYNDSTNALTISVTSNTTGLVQVVYEPGSIISNAITTVTSGTSATFTDNEPAMTLWGISHEGLYTNDTAGGHVTHIDTYRRELESRVVCGLGGNFFSGRTYAESGTTYLMGSSYVQLRERVGTAKTVGPFFVTTGTSTSNARAVTATTIVSNRAPITAAAYTGTSGQVRFTLSLTGKSGTLAGLTVNDKLVVTGMPYSILNGTHSIISTDNTANTVTVSISTVAATDYDVTGTEGWGGVFSDSVVLSGTSPFSAGDRIYSTNFENMTVTTLSSSGTTLYMDGITSEQSLIAVLLLRGGRTSTQVPVASVTNFVVGDMCTVRGIDRQVRVTAVNTSTNVLTIDESLAFEDSLGNQTTVQVSGRWVPIEAPRSTEALPRRTYQRYLTSNDYDMQPIVRSTMSNDNLYLTNGDDDVYKFDGTNLYRAGLTSWQPQLFASLTSIGTGAIARPNVLAVVSAVSSAVLTVSSTAGLTVGLQVVHDQDNAVYTVAEIVSSTSVRMNTAVSGSGSGNLRRLRRLRYYFRLHAIDANNNIIASATSGANDYFVNLVADANVSLKLVGMPTWGAYDYDRLKCQIYRADEDEGLFRRVGEVDIPYTLHDGYILFTDNTDGDEALTIADEVATLLSEAELGNQWEQPLRGKYISTTDNRLALANVKDYPEIALTLQQSTGADITAANLHQKKFLIRRDSTDTGTATSMYTRINYELLDVSSASPVSITPATDITSAATYFNVAKNTHGLAVGDWVYFYRSSAPATGTILTYAGWWQVSAVPDANNFRCRATSLTAPTAEDVNRYVTATTKSDVPVLLGTDGNYGTTTGNSSLSQERLAMIRLANAINATMRMTDTEITGQTTFKPWLVARGGDETGLGKLVVRQPFAAAETFSLKLPGAVTNGSWIGNLVSQAGTETLTASTRQFPSRVIVSQRNYPEIFDGPFGLEADSDTVFDIDPSDGQSITGIISFFAASAFGQASLEDMLVVFKENAIHVLDVRTGQRRKLETQGIGCSAPFSIAYTKNGIGFAHESGVYRLNKDLTISYMGKFIERLFQDEVSHNDLSKAVATHYPAGRQYKLSVPYGDDQEENNIVFVYDYTRETDERVEFGAWSRYTNHPATGWANLGNEAYFATTTGEVFKIRNLGDQTDYRDDASAISMVAVMGALDFGLAGTRKVVRDLTIHFPLRFSDLTAPLVKMAVDLASTYSTLDDFDIDRDDGDSRSIRFDLPVRRGEFFTLRVENAAISEDMRVSGVTYSVAAGSSATILAAANSDGSS